MTAGVKPELLRTLSVELRSGARYIVKELKVAAGDTLSPKQPVAVLEVIRKRKQGDSIVEHVTREHISFDQDIYSNPVISQLMVKEGQELSARSRELFEYSVEETFANLIEKGVRLFIRQETNLFAGGSIPEKKLTNALAAYAPAVESSRVVFLYDSTFFGSAKEGFLITDSGMYLRGPNRAFTLRFSDIEGVELQTRSKAASDKEVQEEVVVITVSDGDTVEITNSDNWIRPEPFKAFLNQVAELDDEGLIKEVDGYVIVQEMPRSVRLAYLHLLVWLTQQDDGIIDERELSELQVLMTQLDFDAELRAQVREVISQPGALELEALVSALLDNVPTGSEQALGASLLKDAVRVHRATSDGSALDSEPIQRLAEILGLDREQVGFIEEACIQDERILAGELSDDELTAMAKDLSARAAAVGVPIAAVYLSGSVAGLSAAGVTSGLASLGLGGLLGFSSMVTGIGVAILLGVGVYKGVRWLTGGAERDKASRRELMLQEVLRIHQKAIANLAEDISFFAKNLVDLTHDVESNKLLIGKLSAELTIFSQAMARLRTREDGFEQNLAKEAERRAA